MNNNPARIIDVRGLTAAEKNQLWKELGGSSSSANYAETKECFGDYGYGVTYGTRAHFSDKYPDVPIVEPRVITTVKFEFAPDAPEYIQAHGYKYKRID